jgi:hypothetical protein
MPPGFTPAEVEVLDLADQVALDEDCFAHWGPREVGEAQPEEGRPSSGPRPPEDD